MSLSRFLGWKERSYQLVRRMQFKLVAPGQPSFLGERLRKKLISM